MTRSRIWLRATLAAALTLATGATSASPTVEPTFTAICEIVRHPDRFHGKIVEVDGRILGESYHGYAVSDRACVIELAFNADARPADLKTALDKAEGSLSLRDDRDTEARIIGTITARPDHGYMGVVRPGLFATLTVSRIVEIRSYRLLRPRA
jgi:hypothetical protein